MSMNIVDTGKIETYIPNDDCARGPLDTGLDILRQGDVVEQEFEEEIGLFLLISDNVAGDYFLFVSSCLMFHKQVYTYTVG
jgi:hypothetical protein